eukprot:m.234036 g.234036  ORF g.234036 m.234036 type:complete len:863 (+) comp12604_c0_seq1:42-2630(+)
MENVIHLGPYQYVHVLDQSKYTERVEVGPKTLVLAGNESIIGGVKQFIVVRPRHYVCIRNPVIKEISDYRNFKLRFGHHEYRFHGEPFPLYPGEELGSSPQPLQSAQPEQAIRLRAEDDVVFHGTPRKAGEEFLLLGPCLFEPQPFVEFVEIVKPIIVPRGSALRLRALRTFTDGDVVRTVGSEWLHRSAGAYLPRVDEEVVEQVDPLKVGVGYHLRSLETHKDSKGVVRCAGEEWLVADEDAQGYIVDVTETVAKTLPLTTLSPTQWCVIVNPATIVDGHVRSALGTRSRREGPQSFYLQPGEYLEKGVCPAYVLQSDQALLLKAREGHADSDAKSKRRNPGDIWLLTGPCQYIPPITVEVLEERNAIVLKDNEGIYVRSVRTGHVRAVMGPLSYVLAADEELWVKTMTPLAAAVLKAGGGIGDGDIRKLAYFESSIDTKPRQPYSVVSYRCPPGCALQIFDFKNQRSRVVLGPNVAILGPSEEFNVLSLSAGKPKVPNALKSIPLMLGPDFITDQIQVETSDHARLNIKYSVNYHFEFDPEDEASLNTMFAVPDFVGFVAGGLASRIRTAVAQTGFDDFHRHSAAVMRRAVFGGPEDDGSGQDDGEGDDSHSDDGQGDGQGGLGGGENVLRFPENNIVLSNLDIQAIDPVDSNMQDLLMRSVQMAISISTKSIEDTARQEANLKEQAARGRLELQNLQSAQEAELERVHLCELRALTAAVESTGQATAEAKARAEGILIEAQSAIVTAQLRAEAARVAAQSELAILQQAREQEIKYLRATAEAELTKARCVAALETARFQASVSAIGSATILAMATAGPQAKVKLLSSLGISSTLVTDGRSPINLFATADGLLGRAAPAQ